ncbi:unnamed protein product, partial [Durusdinium trenchii]
PKVPAAAAPVPFKPVAAAPALERNPFYSQQEQQQHMQEALTAAAPKPAAERPKRGWEKPDLVPKSAAVATGKTSVQDVVSESVKVSTGKTQEGTSSPAVAKPLAAAAGGARQPTVEQDAPTKEPAADAGGDTAAESDKELLKTAFGKWGSKKSFAEVIKAVPATAGEVDVTSANGEAR